MPMRHLPVIAVIAAVGLASCGGDSDDQRLQDERIARAEQEGARKARAEERIRAQEREQKRLKRELEKLKRGGSATASSSNTSSSSAGSTPPPAPSGTPCGDGLSVGPNTSCAFGRSVREEYSASGGSSSISAYSPVTGRMYSMSCSGGVTTVCTGGNNASVSFR